MNTSLRSYQSSSFLLSFLPLIGHAIAAPELAQNQPPHQVKPIEMVRSIVAAKINQKGEDEKTKAYQERISAYRLQGHPITDRFKIRHRLSDIDGCKVKYFPDSDQYSVACGFGALLSTWQEEGGRKLAKAPAVIFGVPLHAPLNSTRPQGHYGALMLYAPTIERLVVTDLHLDTGKVSVTDGQLRKTFERLVLEAEFTVASPFAVSATASTDLPIAFFTASIIFGQDVSLAIVDPAKKSIVRRFQVRLVDVPAVLPNVKDFRIVPLE